jgi:hypothetical protein
MRAERVEELRRGVAPLVDMLGAPAAGTRGLDVGRAVVEEEDRRGAGPGRRLEALVDRRLGLQRAEQVAGVGVFGARPRRGQ